MRGKYTSTLHDLRKLQVNRRKGTGRGTIDRRFFSAMDPSEKSLPDFQEFPSNGHYTHSKRPDHDATYTFDLKIAQDRRLIFSNIQFDSNARKPLLDNSDVAQTSCSDLRLQGEPNQLTQDEGHKKRSRVQSLLMNVLQSQDKDKLMASLFPQSDSKEYQGIFQFSKRHRSRTKQPRSSRNCHDHRRSTVHVV